MILHEDWYWNNDEYDADISLVVLQSKVDLSDPMKVAIICLPSARDVDYEGTGTVVGWGISEASEANYEHFDSTPNEIELPSVTQTQCEEAGNDFHTASSDRTFCAGYLKQGKTACTGDSGGGFVAYDRLRKNYNLAGIVSSSLIDKNLRSCNIDTYSIFTDVGKFVEWMRKNMEETEEIKWKDVDFQCHLSDRFFDL